MIVAIRHFEDFIVDLALFRYLYDLLEGSVWVAVTKVELDGVVKQDAILWNDAYVLSEACHLQIFNVLTVNKHLTVFWIVNAEK
jgi:hypothetical protein